VVFSREASVCFSLIADLAVLQALRFVPETDVTDSPSPFTLDEECGDDINR
jgi:hypothetical protein